MTPEFSNLRKKVKLSKRYRRAELGDVPVVPSLIAQGTLMNLNFVEKDIKLCSS